MLEKLKNARKVVGTKKVLKAVEKGEVAQVFLASDCDLFIYRQVSEACKAHDVPLFQVNSMKELGAASQVAVPTASAAIFKD